MGVPPGRMEREGWMEQDMMGRGGWRGPQIKESTGGWKAAVEILSNAWEKRDGSCYH